MILILQCKDLPLPVFISFHAAKLQTTEEK